MSQEIGSVHVSLGLDTAEYETNLRRASAQAKRFADGQRSQMKSAADSASVFEQALTRQQRSFDRLRNAVDPAAASQARYQEAVRRVNRAVTSGIASQKEGARVLQLAARRYGVLEDAALRASSAQARVATRSNGMAFALQNAGFQIQDIAVQLSMGTSAARAFGQQLPQILSGLGMVGPVALLGTALGTIAAVAIPVISSLRNVDEAADDAGDSVGELASELDQAREAQDAYTQAVELSARAASRITPEILENLRLEFEARKAIAEFQQIESEQQVRRMRAVVEEEEQRLRDLLSEQLEALDQSDDSSGRARTRADERRLEITQEFVAANEGAFDALRLQNAELTVAETTLERLVRGWDEIIAAEVEAGETASATFDAASRSARDASREYMAFLNARIANTPVEESERAATAAERAQEAARRASDAFAGLMGRASGSIGRIDGMDRLVDQYGALAGAARENLEIQREIARVEARRSSNAALAEALELVTTLQVTADQRERLNRLSAEAAVNSSDREAALDMQALAEGIIEAAGGYERLNAEQAKLVTGLTQGSLERLDLASALGQTDALIGKARMLSDELKKAGQTQQDVANDLAVLGFDSDSAGVRAFQESVGAAVDGIVGPETLGKIKDALTEVTEAAETAKTAVGEVTVADIGGPSSDAGEGIAAPMRVALSEVQSDINATQAALGDLSAATAPVVTAAQEAVNAAQVILDGIPERSRQTGVYIIGAMGAGMRTMTDIPASIIDQVGQGITGRIDAVVERMRTSGSEVIAGFVEGMRGRAAAAVEEAAAIANRVAGAARDALEIRSPSRVFNEIGVQTIEGLVQGIKSGDEDVIAAITDMTRQATANTALKDIEKQFKEAGVNSVEGFAKAVSAGKVDILSEMRGITANIDAPPEAMNFGQSLAQSFEQNITSAFQNIGREGFKLGDILKNSVGSALSAIARQLISTGLGSFGLGGGTPSGLLGAIGGLFGGFRADGGPIDRNKGYIVGENGPEWFQPGASGFITPNHMLPPMPMAPANARFSPERGSENTVRSVVELVVSAGPGAVIDVVRNEAGAMIRQNNAAQAKALPGAVRRVIADPKRQ